MAGGGRGGQGPCRRLVRGPTLAGPAPGAAACVEDLTAAAWPSLLGTLHASACEAPCEAPCRPAACHPTMLPPRQAAILQPEPSPTQAPPRPRGAPTHLPVPDEGHALGVEVEALEEEQHVLTGGALLQVAHQDVAAAAAGAGVGVGAGVGRTGQGARGCCGMPARGGLLLVRAVGGGGPAQGRAGRAGRRRLRVRGGVGYVGLPATMPDAPTAMDPKHLRPCWGRVTPRPHRQPSSLAPLTPHLLMTRGL